MIIDGKIRLLGDTHLGREFVRNVPLHRRGDRERLVWAQFEKDLNPEGCEVHIHMGDLFDKVVVDNNTVLRAAQLYRQAADAHRDTNFYILAGNHDLSRDLETRSSFEVFHQIVMFIPNIIVVVTRPHVVPSVSTVLCPWHPVASAAEMVEWVDFKPRYAFGHWDVDPRSAPFNLIPTTQLAAAGIERAFTGHVHLPTSFKRDGVDVTVVGSMQPFAHGEEDQEQFYVTRSLAEFDAEDVASFKNKCLRIRLNPGEVWDREVDCLQLQVEKLTEEDVEAIDVTLGDFDLAKIFETNVAGAGLPKSVEDELRARWQTAFS